VLEQLCPSLAQVVLCPPSACLQSSYIPNQAFSRRLAPLQQLLCNSSGLHNHPEINQAAARTASFVYRARTIESTNETSMSVTTTFLTSADTLGVQYRFSAYRYIGTHKRSTISRPVHSTVARSLELALQLYGGPDITTSGCQLTTLRTGFRDPESQPHLRLESR